MVTICLILEAGIGALAIVFCLFAVNRLPGQIELIHWSIYIRNYREAAAGAFEMALYGIPAIILFVFVVIPEVKMVAHGWVGMIYLFVLDKAPPF